MKCLRKWQTFLAEKFYLSWGKFIFKTAKLGFFFVDICTSNVDRCRPLLILLNCAIFFFEYFQQNYTITNRELGTFIESVFKLPLKNSKLNETKLLLKMQSWNSNITALECIHWTKLEPKHHIRSKNRKNKPQSSLFRYNLPSLKLR